MKLEWILTSSSIKIKKNKSNLNTSFPAHTATLDRDVENK
jgi:hypothetical protein